MQKNNKKSKKAPKESKPAKAKSVRRHRTKSKSLLSRLCRDINRSTRPDITKALLTIRQDLQGSKKLKRKLIIIGYRAPQVGIYSS